MRRDIVKILFIALVIILIAGCGGSIRHSEKPILVTTTTIIRDVVASIAGTDFDVVSLLPVGADPHVFEPSPTDIRTLNEADIIYINGLGLEKNLDSFLNESDLNGKTVDLSSAIHPDTMTVGDEGQAHAVIDPHVWTNPRKVIYWVDTIEKTLVDRYPAKTDSIRRNSTRYCDKLVELDNWIVEQIAEIPREKRMIVSDHRMFGYFCKEYGFVQVGAVLPGFSSLAAPSARDLAKLEDAIHRTGVEAILVGHTVNPVIAERIAQDTGTHLVKIYTGSLGEPGSGADTYIKMTKHNVTSIMNSLKQ